MSVGWIDQDTGKVLGAGVTKTQSTFPIRLGTMFDTPDHKPSVETLAEIAKEKAKAVEDLSFAPTSDDADEQAVRDEINTWKKILWAGGPKAQGAIGHLRAIRDREYARPDGKRLGLVRSLASCGVGKPE